MKKKGKILSQIADRKKKKNLLADDKTSLMMDLDLADKKFNLRLEELLNAKDFDFIHDITGIQKHINRQELEFNGLFVPRFSN